jgi:hypothetical protein
MDGRPATAGDRRARVAGIDIRASFAPAHNGLLRAADLVLCATKGHAGRSAPSFPARPGACNDQQLGGRR